GGSLGTFDLLELVDLRVLAIVRAANALREEGLKPGIGRWGAHEVALSERSAWLLEGFSNHSFRIGARPSLCNFPYSPYHLFPSPDRITNNNSRPGRQSEPSLLPGRGSPCGPDQSGPRIAPPLSCQATRRLERFC